MVNRARRVSVKSKGDCCSTVVSFKKLPCKFSRRKQNSGFVRVDLHANYTRIIFHALPYIKKVSIPSLPLPYESKPPAFPATSADHPAKNQHAPRRTSPFEYSSLGRRARVGSRSIYLARIVPGMLLPLVIHNAWNIKPSQAKASSLTIVPPGHCCFLVFVPGIDVGKGGAQFYRLRRQCLF